MTNETISEKCETLYNKLNAFVTSVISRDVTPKISNLNTEVWGSDTQTGNSRIDTLNTNFNNLDGSITSMKSDINNVESDINTIESDVSNLQTSVNSLSDSITNINTYTTYLDNANYTVKYNDYRVIIDVHLSSTTFPVTLSNFGANVIPANCLPPQPVTVPLQNVNAIVSIRNNSQGIWRKSNTGSAITGVSCYCHIEYSRV